MATSYAQSLPLGFSRQVRNRLREPEFAAIFPKTKMSADSTGIEAWHTTEGGGYIAAGIGTGITGKGFHVGIVRVSPACACRARSASTGAAPIGHGTPPPGPARWRARRCRRIACAPAAPRAVPGRPP